jgi:hypothetical protein
MFPLAMTPDIKGEKVPASVVSKILNTLKHSVVDPDPYVSGPRIRILPSTSRKSKKSHNFDYFVTFFLLLTFED